MGGICSTPSSVVEPPKDEKQTTTIKASEPVAPVENAKPEKKVEIEEETAKEEEGEETGEDSDFDDFADYEKTVNPRNILNAEEFGPDADSGINVRSEKEMEEDNLFETEEDEGKVSFMAVKPWKGAIVPPTDAPANDGSMPDQQLKLEWAYGYRSHDSRNNIAVVDGNIIYPTAGLVVKYNPAAHTQEHFMGHSDDVLCLAQHPTDPAIVATGQVATIVDRHATHPHICVWNSKTGESWLLKNAGKRAIRTVGFSASGRFLASVGNDNKLGLSVWDWANGKRLATESADVLPHKVFQVKWRDETSFYTVGVKHIFFWTFENGVLKKRRGKTRGKGYSGFSVDFLADGGAVVGTKSGSLALFEGDILKRSVKAHAGAVFAVKSWEGGVLTGGKDGHVVVWNNQLKVQHRWELTGQIRSIAIDGTSLVVGTNLGALWRIRNFADEDNGEIDLLFRNHHDGELWGLDVDPKDPRFFASGGEDNEIFVWDAEQHKTVVRKHISNKKGARRKKNRASSSTTQPGFRCVRSVAFSPEGDMLASGSNHGHLLVYRRANLELLVDHDLNKFSKQNVRNKWGNWIQTLKFSPCGNYLAVGTHGSVVVLCDVRNDFAPTGVLKAHNAAVTHLDWSKDGTSLQTNCRGYELLFHSVNPENLKASKQEKRASALKDKEWATQSCILGWPVQGVFDPSQDGTDVNTVARSPDGTLVASGDDYGMVNLYRYPVLENTNQHRVLAGHSSHVMNVAFSKDGRYLFSAGGEDKTILQWRVQ